MRTQLIINTQFAALHNWSTVPDDHTQSYLKFPHRHVFDIQVKFAVEGHDREIEFIEIKNILNDWLRAHFHYPGGVLGATPDLGSMSCEMLAAVIMQEFSIYDVNPVYVRVLEDGENGAEVSI